MYWKLFNTHPLILTTLKNRIIGLLMLAYTLVCAARLDAAIVYTSNVTSGNWSGTSTWTQTGSSGYVIYVIQTGHTITLDVNVSGIDQLWIYGTLRFGNSKTLNMTQAGFINISATGSFSGGNANSGIWYGSYSGVWIRGPFNGKDLINNGPRYGDYSTMIAANGDPQPSFPIGLPVDISSMTVEQSGSEFSLKWTALDESNQNSFEVEVSEDAVNFTSAGIVEGNKELSEGNYELNLGTHKNSFFVRLTEISQTESKSIATQYVHSGIRDFENFLIFPTILNPAENNLNMVLPAVGEHRFCLFNTSMQSMAEVELTTETENELRTISMKNIRLTPGVYFTEVISPDGTVFKNKLIVQ